MSNGFDHPQMGSQGPYNPLPTCGTCRLEILPPNSLRGLRGYGNNQQYCSCVKVQSPMPSRNEKENARLRDVAALWFEHPSPIERHEREMQYQAYKARLMLELGLLQQNS